MSGEALIAVSDDGVVLYREDLDVPTACQRVIETNETHMGAVPGAAVAVAQARFILRAYHDRNLLKRYGDHVKECIARNELPRPLPRWLGEQHDDVLVEFTPHPLDEIRRAFPGG